MERILKNIEQELAGIGKKLIAIEKQVDHLVASKAFDTGIPLLLRDAALACKVELRWLRERVTRNEIVAYRATSDAPWRIYPKDILSFLTQNCNQVPARRQRVLKNLKNIKPEK